MTAYSKTTLARRCPACLARAGRECHAVDGSRRRTPHPERVGRGHRQYQSVGVSVAASDKRKPAVVRDRRRYTL